MSNAFISEGRITRRSINSIKNARSKIVLAFMIIVFGLMVLISIYCLTLKRDALQFHTRDYNYFIEQAARLTDPQMTKRFTLNIEGYNFLGLQGIEGVKSLYHAIHTEIFRYSYVLLYRIFHRTEPIYIFYSVIFFLPILYFAFIAIHEDRNVWRQAFFFTLLYVLFPATLNEVTADLRPRMLFVPAWILVCLAIYFHRPFIEKLIFFILLLSIREEAILLGAIIIVLNFLHMQGKPGRWRQTFLWLILDISALAVFLAFMAWGEFTRVDNLYNPRNIIYNLQRYSIPFTLGGVFLFILLGLFYFKRRAQLKNVLLLFIYLAAMLLTSVQLARWLPSWYQQQSLVAKVTLQEIYFEALSNPLTALPLYMGLLLLVLLWDFTRRASQKFLVAALVVLSVVFTTTTLITYPKQITAWRENLPFTGLVWDFVHSHDRLQTDVLLDYETYQAFYDYENILVYNRLPLWLALPDKRFYPDNKAALVRHIRRRMEYSVVSQSSVKDIFELAQMAGVPVTEVVSNERYVVLKFGN
jgi:hypothetical protein